MASSFELGTHASKVSRSFCEAEMAGVYLRQARVCMSKSYDYSFLNYSLRSRGHIIVGRDLTNRLRGAKPLSVRAGICFKKALA